MIAENDVVIYDDKQRKILAEVKKGLEFHTTAKVFNGTLEEFKISVQDAWDEEALAKPIETSIERVDPEPIEDIS